jgi:hypothetical protein
MVDVRPELTDDERIAQLRSIAGEPPSGPYDFERPIDVPAATAAAGDAPPPTVTRQPPSEQFPAQTGVPDVAHLDADFASRIGRLKTAGENAMPGVEWRLESGYRDLSTQADLYAKYQAGGPLAAAPGSSFHNYGGAVDMWPYRDGQKLSRDEAMPLLKQLSDMAPDQGVYPGWNFGDHDHFQGAQHLSDWLASRGKTMATSAAGVSGAVLPALDQAISNASAATGVPTDVLRAFSIVESAGGRNLGIGMAHNGPFGLGADEAAATGVKDRMDFNQSALGAAKLMTQYKDSLERLLGHEVGWDQAYLAYNQGPGNAQALLANPQARAVDMVGSEKAVTQNGGTPDMSAGAFADLVMAKYRRAAAGNYGASPAPGKVWAPVSSNSVIEQLADAFKPAAPTLAGPSLDPSMGAMSPEAMEDASKVASVVESAGKSARLNDLVGSHELAQFETTEQRNKMIKEQLGMPDLELDNPSDTGMRELWALDHGIPFTFGAAPHEIAAIDALRVQDYQAKLGDLAARFPLKAAIMQADRPYEEVTEEGARRLAETARGEAAAAYEAAPPGVARAVGAFAGQAGAFMASPMGLVSLTPFGAELKATTMLGKLMTRGIQEAVVNAGLTFFPGLMEDPNWRTATERPTDLEGRLKEAGEAGAFGAVFGMGLHAAGNFTSLVMRAARGDLSAGAELARGLQPGAETSLPSTVLSAALDREAKPAPVAGGPPGAEPKPAIGADGKVDTSPPDIAKPPDTADGKPLRLAAVTPEENAQKLGEHIRYAENPEGNPKPDPPSAALDPPVTVGGREHVPAIEMPLSIPERATTGVIDYGGKTVHYEDVRPGELTTDAQTFQYKGGGDFRGDTDTLGGAAKWDPEAGGRVIAFEREDGTRVIADGHQRLGLAQRLESSSGRPIDMPAYVFREADGWTAEQVRSIAAKTNILEGNAGTAMDVARILRERPELWDATMLLEDPRIKQAQGLARLSPEAWAKVVNGEVQPNYAAAVGRMATDPNIHAGIIDDLVRHGPPNETAARLMIGDNLEAVNRRDVYDQMAGRPPLTRDLVLERAQVFQRAAGVLARELPERSEAELNRLATRSPEVSAALTRWADELRNGTASEREAASGFAGEVQALDAQGRLADMPHEPRLPDIVADTPAAMREQIEGLQASLSEREPGAPLDRETVADHLDAGLMREWRGLTDMHERMSRWLAEVRARARTGELRPQIPAEVAALRQEIADLTGKKRMLRRDAQRVVELRQEIDRLEARQPQPTREVAALEQRVERLDLRRREIAERVSDTYRQADALMRELEKRRPVEVVPAAEAKAPEAGPRPAEGAEAGVPTSAEVPKPEAAATPTAAAEGPAPTGERKSAFETTVTRNGKTEAMRVEYSPSEIARAAEAAGMSHAEAAVLERRMRDAAPSVPAGAPDISDKVAMPGPNGETTYITREQALAAPREEEIATLLEDCKI